MKKDKVTVWGGIGEKKSNNGTQWYMQDRIYDPEGLCPALTTFKSDYWVILNKNKDIFDTKIYYDGRLDEPKILVMSIYEDYLYVILTLGTHPTAYVCLDETHPFFELDYDEIPINCHGGLTYSANTLGANHQFINERDHLWVIGWDYCHYHDWDTYMSREDNISLGNKKHTLKEIVGECIDVIDQLKNFNKEKEE